MENISGSPLVVKKFVGHAICDMHGDCFVIYQGRACPLCLALDDANDARCSERWLQDEIHRMSQELGPCS